MKKIETRKKEGRTIIALSGYLDTDYFYNELMDEIYNYQFSNDSIHGKLAPILSFENVSAIDSNVLPCLVAIGVIMKKYYNKPCLLHFDYSLTGLPLLQYLYTTKFLYLVKNKLFIFDFEDENIGGFSLLEKDYNPNYTIEYFSHIKDYYYLAPMEQDKIKFQTQDNLIVYDVPRIFGNVIKKVLDVNTQEYDWCVRCIAEIIANAELYSLSDSFASVQAKKNIVRISLCDVGIGFAGSLQLKRIDINNNLDLNKFTQRYYNGKNGLNKKAIDDLNCFLIALEEAEDSALNKDSNNLYRLIDIITSINGNVKIHFNKTQVSFDKDLFNIYKNLSRDNFMEYLLNNYNSEPSYLKIYKANINGVHIEIKAEFENTKGDNNVR